MQKGMRITNAPKTISEDCLKLELDKNILLLHACEEPINKMFRFMTDKCLFLVTDASGIILKIWTKKKIKQLGIIKGMSFAEEDCGTNAIAMALKLKVQLYMMPEYNYSDFFKKVYCFAAPIFANEKDLCGCFAVMAVELPIKMQLMAIAELLLYRISKEIAQPATAMEEQKECVNLKDNHKQILKLLASGLSDKLIAAEIKRSINTVRYHKRVIFEKLNAVNSMEAVMKSIKYKLISIEDINN